MNWYVAPALDTLRDELNAAHPGRDRSSDGAIGDASHQARPSDHNPDWTAGGVVRARDFDVDGIPVRPILAVLQRDERTRYLIYDKRIWTREHGWQPYTGLNPHTGHFHISVRKGARYENDTRPWGVGGDDMSEKAERQIDALYQAMFYGSTAGGVKYPGLLAIEAETQKRVTAIPSKVWAVPVKRASGPVSALQELADAKTHTIALEAGISALAAAQGKNAADTVAAVRDEVRKALADGTVRVEITVPNTEEGAER